MTEQERKEKLDELIKGMQLYNMMFYIIHIMHREKEGA